MVIARLLTPADIGTFSVTMVLLTFVATVRDMGAGGYLVQEPDLTIDRIKAVWAVQLGLGLLLALVVAVCSVPASIFYSEPRMRDIMLVVALNYAINPFGSLTYAWQIREMRFDSLAIVRFCATIAGAAVSIGFAWRQYGPISLAFGSLASSIVNAAMAVYYRPKWFPWLPGLKEVNRVLAYGSQTTGAAMIQTLSGNAPELLLGKLQNMTATGLFSRASGLIQMFDRLVLTALGSVAISWFAKQSRDHGDVAQPFLKATSYVVAIGTSFSLGVIFLAHPAMRVLYGGQWDGAVDLTRLMGVALVISLPAALVNAVLMATGGAARVLRGMAVTTVATVILVAIGAVGGLIQMGICLILASAFRTVYWVHQAKQVLSFEWRELARVLSSSAVVGAGGAIFPALAFAIFGPHPSNIWAPLALGVSGGLAGFFGTILLIKHPLADELFSVVASVRRKFA